MVIFVRVQVEDPGLRAGEGDPPQTDQPLEYIEYFEDLSASGGLKFEPVEAKRRSRSSGTQAL